MLFLVLFSSVFSSLVLFKRRSGGLPSLPKEEKKEENEEEKKKDDDKQGEMKGKRNNEEDMQDILVAEDGMIVKFSLVPLPLVSLVPFATCLLPQ